MIFQHSYKTSHEEDKMNTIIFKA